MYSFIHLQYLVYPVHDYSGLNDRFFHILAKTTIKFHSKNLEAGTNITADIGTILIKLSAGTVRNGQNSFGSRQKHKYPLPVEQNIDVV